MNTGVIIRTFEPVVVAAMDLPRGTMIDKSHVRRETMETTQMRAGFFHQPDSLLTMRTTRLVKAGKVILENMVEPIPLVERGDMVTLVVRQANVVITTVGKALEAGCMHDVINVKNVDSNKRLKGEIIDVRRVLIRRDLR